jgi:hypothetical protein
MRHLTISLALVLGVAAPAADLPVRTVLEGQHCRIKTGQRQVARTAAEWRALWDRFAPPDTRAPKVDWSGEMVLAAFMGTRPTGGNQIRIAGVREEKGKLRVSLEKKAPPQDGIVIQVLTAPFHVVAVKKSSLPVVWESR